MRAGLAVLEVSDGLQPYVEELHGKGFGISVGIHCGPTVVGAVGRGASRVVTAIGDTVNTAARVEWANRTHGTRLLVSEPVAGMLGPRFETTPLAPVDLPGKSGRHILYAVRAFDV